MPYLYAMMHQDQKNIENALYACLICMPYMYASEPEKQENALYVCLICMPYMYASEPEEHRECLICMPCMYALHVCIRTRKT